MGLRVVMGLANCLFFLGGCPILAGLYPKDLTKAMGAYKAFFGIGMMVGFLLGSLFYSLFGYIATFLIMAGMNAVAVPFFMCVIPSEHDIDQVKEKLVEAGEAKDFDELLEAAS